MNPVKIAFGAQPSTKQAAFVIPYFRDGDKVVLGFILRRDGSFGFPGGGMEKCETLIETVYRETEEEIGVKLVKTMLKPLVSYSIPEKDLDVHAYSYQLISHKLSARLWSGLALTATHGYEHFGMVWVDVMNCRDFFSNQFASAVKHEVDVFLKSLNLEGINVQEKSSNPYRSAGPVQ